MRMPAKATGGQSRQWIPAEFDGEIVAVPVPQRKGPPVEVSQDERPRRDTTMEALSRLKPAFRPDGNRDGWELFRHE
jgi:acetyl-CoA acetyltransferase